MGEGGVQGRRLGAPLRHGLLAVAALAVLSGCGDDDAEDSGPLIVQAGYVDIQLPEDFTVPTSTAAGDAPAGEDGPVAGGDAGAAPTSSNAAEGEDLPAEDEPEDTIPLEESDEPASARMLRALGIFNSCLEDEGIEFIGAPSPDNPATQDPAYTEALATCAARSNIVQALADAQAENENLSPEEIQEQNESYLVWRECMIDRGWVIPEPVPDAEGRLFSFSQGGDGGAGMQPPAGESLLDSPDLGECADEAAREADAG